MATWGELSKFTWGEVEQFTYDQLNRLTIDELTSLANSKIDTISKSNPEFANNLNSTLSIIGLNIASAAIYDITKSVDWVSVLKSFVEFVQKL